MGKTLHRGMEPGAFKVPHVGTRAPIQWLQAGSQDLYTVPGISLCYGALFMFAGWLLIAVLFVTGYQWLLLPLLAGLLLVGPLLAVGLYETSRRLSAGEPTSLSSALFVKTASPTQIAFTGVVLMLLFLAWVRMAMLVYALFFGMEPFPGVIQFVDLLLFSQKGLAMLVVGTGVGAGFALLAFAISFFSIPMLMTEKIDAVTAMARSIKIVSHNPRVMAEWGILVTVLSVLGFATGFVGMVVIFPLLGYATWHAYDDLLGQHEDKTK